MLKLWEVISVVQDLPYDRQLEILDKLNVSGALKIEVFRDYFVMTDHKLMKTLQSRPHLEMLAAYADRRLLTRLTVVYVLTAITTFEFSTILEEFVEYFASFAFETQILVYRSLPIALKLLDETLADNAVGLGIESVRKLQKEIPLFDLEILKKAVELDKIDIIDELLQYPLDYVRAANYVGFALESANETLLEKILNVYDVNVYDDDRRELMENLLNKVTYYIVRWDPNDTDERTRARVRILLTIDPEADAGEYVGILKVYPKLFAMFVLYTIDLFDWQEYTDHSIVEAILDEQV